MTKYHKSLVRQLVNTTAHGNIKTLTNIQFMLGFSDHQISQVVENLGLLFSFLDIYNYVEIWDKQHALKILSIIGDAFGDVNEENQSCSLLSDDNIFDDELLDEQNKILQDEELFDTIVDNIIYPGPSCRVLCLMRYMLQMGHLKLLSHQLLWKLLRQLILVTSDSLLYLIRY